MQIFMLLHLAARVNAKIHVRFLRCTVCREHESPAVPSLPLFSIFVIYIQWDLITRARVRRVCCYNLQFAVKLKYDSRPKRECVLHIINLFLNTSRVF